MSSTPSERALPKRKTIFLRRGFQLRFALLVSGSLSVLLLFTGLHGVFVVRRALTPSELEAVLPLLTSSTWQLFLYGALYVAVMTVAAVFLSHRAVGPVGRLESEIRAIADSADWEKPLKVRDGDGLESLVEAVNALIQRAKERGS